MKKQKKPQYFVYLGGHHKNNGDWREEFNSVAMEMTRGLDIAVIGINPFDRKIDETNHEGIVGRDFSIIADPRLTHIVLKSADLGTVLSYGAACEKMFACFLNKPVILIGNPECNKVYSSGACFSEWQHPFGHVLADATVASVKDAVFWIVSGIIQPKPKKSWGERIKQLCEKHRFGQNGDIDPFDVDVE